MQINERYNPNMGHIPMNFAPENPQPEKPKTSGVKKFFKWAGIAFAALFVIGLIGSIVNPPEEAEQVAVEQQAPAVEPVAEEAVEAPAVQTAAEETPEPSAVEAPPEPVIPTTESAVKEALPDATVQDLGDQLNVVFPISDNLTKGFRIIGAQSDTLDIIKAAKDSGYPGTVYIEGTFPMVDAYGAESTDSIIFLTYSPETVAKIQPDTIPQDKIWDVADTAGIHPEMRK